MPTDVQPGNRTAQVEIRADRMAALLIVSGADCVPTEDALFALTQEAHLVDDDALRGQIAAIAAGRAPRVRYETDNPNAVVFVLAQGVPPVEAVDGEVELVEALRPKAKGDGERVDHFAESHFITVSSGMIIGRVISPKDGAPGRNVLGNAVEPKRAHGRPIEIGGGLRLVGEARELEAQRDGRFVRQDRKVSLSEVLSVAGDVDFESGSVRSLVDVDIVGSVRPQFHVSSERSVRIGRAVEQANIDAGGDVTIGGGAFGGEHHTAIRSKGAVHAHLFNEIVVEAEGDVTFDKEAILARIRSGGQVRSEHGVIVGGQVYGREGVSVRTIGSESAAATAVMIGQDPESLRQARQIETDVATLKRSSTQIRELVAPLLANLKRLTAEQRERATELLSKADEVDMRVDERLAERDALLAAHRPKGQPALLVREMVYPGVTFVDAPRQVRITELIHGPVRIESRKVDDVTEVVVVNQRTGSVRVLHATELSLDSPAH